MKKHIPPLLWILAAVLFCSFLVVSRSGGNALLGHCLFYGSFAVLDVGCLVKTITNRHVNSSVTNYGFKLMGVLVFFLLILVSFARAILEDTVFH